LRQGVQVLEFRRLPGWIDEASVRLALLPAEAGRIVDVQVSREFLAQAGDQELQKAEAVARAMADEMAAIDDDLKALAQQAKQIEDVRVFSMEKLPRDMAARDIGIETYAKAVDFVADALRRNAAARRELEHKRRDIEPRRAAHAKKLEQLQGLVQLQQTLVRATVDGAAAGKADVALTYMLPGATWEPVHELRAVGQTPDAGAFTSYAVISQTTGEDWIGADLAFATQSSEATIRIPELSALLLNDRTVPRLSAAGPDTFARAQALYKEQNGRWYAYNRGAAADADFFDNATRQE
jgi:uncharacterized protein (TIGR02231 family)